MLKNCFIHIVLSAIACLMSFTSVRSGERLISQGSATIQATANVVPSLGITELRTIEPELAMGINEYEPGSHLFWLYAPKPSGVTVSVKQLGGSFETSSVTTELPLLQAYDYVSLVDLDPELIAPHAAGGDILITITYTDN